jgi:monofunctional biosynthetic peptidoglycan transglycosylase
VVGRDGLDSCVYAGSAAPAAKAPPPVTRKPRPLPGEEYETTKPLPPVEDVVRDLPAATSEPLEQSPAPPAANEPAPAAEPAEEPANAI